MGSGDAEAAAGGHAAREQRKKKRTKCFLYIVLFVIFQSGIIAIFALTIMKVRTPRFRVREATFTTFNAAPANSSLRLTMVPQFSVKNTNFGRYKYRNTTVEFFYRGAKIGEVAVPNSKAGWRSTKRFTASAVNLNIAASSQLTSDLAAGVVPITSKSQVRGRVELVFIMKKNKGTKMDCSMNIAIATQAVTNIVCK